MSLNAERYLPVQSALVVGIQTHLRAMYLSEKMSLRRKYDLYYTLNTHIPTREFTKDELDTFWVNIGKLNTLQSQAVVLLIYEYSLVEAELIYLPESIVLPYNGKQKKTSVSFEYERLPSNLKWILFKFFEVLNIPSEG